MKINLLSTLLQNSNTIWYTWMTFKTSQVESLRPKTLFKQYIVLYVTLNMWSNCFNWFNYFYISALTILIVKYITLFRFRMTKRHWLIISTVSHFSLYYNTCMSKFLAFNHLGLRQKTKTKIYVNSPTMNFYNHTYFHRQ